MHYKNYILEEIVNLYKRIILLIFSFLLPVFSFAQIQIGFVQSERIRAEYEEFKEAESELQLEFRKVQFEFQTMAQRLDSLKSAFETQRLMSSPERRREQEAEIANLENQVNDFQTQPETHSFQQTLKETEQVSDSLPTGVSIESASYMENNNLSQEENHLSFIKNQDGGEEEYTPKLFSEEQDQVSEEIISASAINSSAI